MDKVRFARICHGFLFLFILFQLASGIYEGCRGQIGVMFFNAVLILGDITALKSIDPFESPQKVVSR